MASAAPQGQPCGGPMILSARRKSIPPAPRFCPCQNTCTPHPRRRKWPTGLCVTWRFRLADTLPQHGVGSPTGPALWGPHDFICSAEVNSACAKVLPLSKHLYAAPAAEKVADRSLRYLAFPISRYPATAWRRPLSGIRQCWHRPGCRPSCRTSRRRRRRPCKCPP